MTGVVLVGYGDTAAALVAAATEDSEPGANISTIGVTRRAGLENQREKLAAAVRAADDGGGVLVLTDSEPGLAGHLAQSIAGTGRVTIVSGLNLPMLIAVIDNCDRLALDTLAVEARDAGRRGILMTA